MGYNTLDFTGIGVENKHSVCKRQDSVIAKCLKMELDRSVPEFRFFSNRLGFSYFTRSSEQFSPEVEKIGLLWD